jgi:hypothetical protein
VSETKPALEPEVQSARQRMLDEWKTSVGRGLLPVPLRKPIIYFAGRMKAQKWGDDWRNSIGEFEGLYSAVGGDQTIRSDRAIDCGSFWYGGPFYVDYTGGHCCGHLAGLDRDWDSTDARRDIWDADTRMIQRANLFVAYIDDAEAYGTLVEIGYAAALQKYIVIGFSDTMKNSDYAQLWLSRMTAAKCYWGKPGDVWNQVKHDWIAT